MPRLDARPDYGLLVRLLADPSRFRALTPQQFSAALDVATQARLLGWLLDHAEREQLPSAPPGWLADRMTTVRCEAREYDRALGWEIDRLNQAFSAGGVPWALLKGAAYVAAALPPGRGRQVADIDVLVPYERLAEAERALQAHGWVYGELHPYDVRYYREWMHELPPLMHAERQSVVDVHHAILPTTSRVHPSPGRLLERAVTTAGGARVLCPSHMVLHAAAHLFHDGEVAGAIRDLVDVDRLLREFRTTPGFWDDLLREAEVLQLQRPAYYTLRYTVRLLATSIPADVVTEISRWAPPAPVGGLMDALVARAISGESGPRSSGAAFALYVRSHWLRMPPLMLARHLLTKSMRRT